MYLLKPAGSSRNRPRTERTRAGSAIGLDLVADLLPGVAGLGLAGGLREQVELGPVERQLVLGHVGAVGLEQELGGGQPVAVARLGVGQRLRGLEQGLGPQRVGDAPLLTR